MFPSMQALDQRLMERQVGMWEVMDVALNYWMPKMDGFCYGNPFKTWMIWGYKRYMTMIYTYMYDALQKMSSNSSSTSKTYLHLSSTSAANNHQRLPKVNRSVVCQVSNQSHPEWCNASKKTQVQVCPSHFKSHY